MSPATASPQLLLTRSRAATGSYGQAGGNVPGAAASFRDISGWDLVDPAQAAKALELDVRPLGPPAKGWVTAAAVYRAVLEADPYAIKMLLSFGTNLLSSQPDQYLAQQALTQLDFHVHADFFLNATAQYADIVLPVSTSWEREALRTGFDASLAGQRRVQFRQRVIEPCGDTRSDTDIVMGLAQRLGFADKFFGLSANAGHEWVLADTPLSLQQLRANPPGLDVPGEVALAAHQKLDASGHAAGFPTPTRRVEVYSEALLEHGEMPLPNVEVDQIPSARGKYPLMLGCAKSLVYCHSQQRNWPSLRRLLPDPPLDMAAADATIRDIHDGDWVRILTASGEALARVSIRRQQLAGTVFAQHGWWDGGSADAPYGTVPSLAANLNQLFDSSARDPVSGSITLRATPCQIVRM